MLTKTLSSSWKNCKTDVKHVMKPVGNTNTRDDKLHYTSYRWILMYDKLSVAQSSCVV